MNLSRPVIYSYLLQGVGLAAALFLVFSLEPRWASCLSTLGGTVLFFLGVKSKKSVVRLSGLLLQCIGLYLFLYTVWYPFQASILYNSYFLGSCFIVLSAFFSAFYLERNSNGRSKKDRWIVFFLLFLGTIMWYAGGFREVYMNIVIQEQLNGVLLFIAATSIIAGIIGEKSHWKRLHYFLLLQLPMMLCILIFELLGTPVDYPLLTGWGTTVWPVTFFVQYRILAVLDGEDWPTLGGAYHLISLWMVLFVSSREFILQVLQETFMNFFSISLIIVVSVNAWFFMVRSMAKKRYWPVALFPDLYLWGGLIAIVSFMFCWFLTFASL